MNNGFLPRLSLISASGCFISLALLLFTNSPAALADKLCLRVRLVRAVPRIDRRVVASSARCTRGYTQLVDTVSFTGPQGAIGATGAAGSNGSNGAAGANGTDGAVRVYGDGSAGAYTSGAGLAYLPSTNLQFSEFNVPVGSTLYVPSGITIRSTGDCKISGILSVIPAAQGGTRSVGLYNGTTSFIIAERSANPGGTAAAAATGSAGTDAVNQFGGQGGLSLANGTVEALHGIFSPPLFGGGGGAGGHNGPGGNGAGSVRLICQGEIRINAGGTLGAFAINGSLGSGGGGGGLVILASGTGIVNAGTVAAFGAVGGNCSSESGAGGGGGGGLVRFIAPVIDNTSGTVNVDGGAAGTQSATVTNSPRSAGSGGGAGFGGNGGDGSNVDTSGVCSGAQAGAAGYFLQTIVDDPIGLLL